MYVFGYVSVCVCGDVACYVAEYVFGCVVVHVLRVCVLYRRVGMRVRM